MKGRAEWWNNLERINPRSSRVKGTLLQLMSRSASWRKGARHWWESAHRAYDIANSPMGWDRFKEVFYDK
ncbi:unnamed protein product [Prunus armeniaca]|uniref:Uncharacterized protein n=1 Tax=Prunus armeniaca TaxID=36596 RepID=A0A6J5TLZ7_PRUAR|nr:unnamed protein product [Prunus armeniaca]